MNTEFKMIASDLDYTLLNSKKEISERTRLALHAAAEKGIKIVIATGRIYASARHFGDLLQTNAPVVASNGAIIRDRCTGATLQRKTLPTQVILEILEIAKKYSIQCHLFSDDTIYAESYTQTCDNYVRWNGTIEEETNRVKIDANAVYPDTIIAHEGEIIKVIATDEIDRIQAFWKEVDSKEPVSISHSLKNNIEIMSRGMTKGNAVKLLAEHYGFAREEILSFGDNHNDLSMIEYAGTGVAVGNAEAFLKERADYVADTCDNNGVAKFLEEFVL